jgi:hypothetical protein
MRRPPGAQLFRPWQFSASEYAAREPARAVIFRGNPSMRRLLTAAAFAAALASPAAQAQGSDFMWCTATADNGAEKTYYYSAFFAAGAWEAERKAFAFKREVEEQEISAVTVTATCVAPADYDTVVATRNAAMKAAPGTVLSWEG